MGAVDQVLLRFAPALVGTSPYVPVVECVHAGNLYAIICGLQLRLYAACREARLEDAIALARMLDQILIAAMSDSASPKHNYDFYRTHLRVALILTFGSDESVDVQSAEVLISMCLADLPCTIEDASREDVNWKTLPHEELRRRIKEVRTLRRLKVRLAPISAVFPQLSPELQERIEPWMTLTYRLP